MDMFPFVAGSYDSRSTKFDCQRTVNLYPEASGSGNSKSIAMLIGTPGTVFWGTNGGPTDSVARGAFRFSSSIMIAVNGASVVKFDATGASVVIGTILDGENPVSMASNGEVIMLVTGGTDGYFIDPVANTVTLIADPAFVGADRVDFLKGYFLCNILGTQEYQAIGPYTTTIDPLAFASAEGAPDLLVSLIVANSEAVLLGETSVEFHGFSGNVDFPFEAIQGAFIGMGCAAKNSVARLTDANGQSMVCWLTANEQGFGQIVRNVGYQPQRISDHAVEYQIAKLSRLDDAVAFTYQQEGHSFYMLTFPTDDRTFCYDFSTELWHERASTRIAVGSGIVSGAWNTGRHLANCHVFFANKNLVGDFDTGQFYYFDLDTYTDRHDSGSTFFFGQPIIAIRQCPHLAANDAWQIFDELWIDMETGVGLNDNVSFTAGGDVILAGKDPQMLLEWSDDGGRTFPNSRAVAIGKLGQIKTRAIARRLGKSRDRVFRVSITDPVRRCFIDAGTRVRVGAR